MGSCHDQTGVRKDRLKQGRTFHSHRTRTVATAPSHKHQQFGRPFANPEIWRMTSKQASSRPVATTPLYPARLRRLRLAVAVHAAHHAFKTLYRRHTPDRSTSVLTSNLSHRRRRQPNALAHKSTVLVCNGQDVPSSTGL